MVIVMVMVKVRFTGRSVNGDDLGLSLVEVDGVHAC